MKPNPKLLLCTLLLSLGLSAPVVLAEDAPPPPPPAGEQPPKPVMGPQQRLGQLADQLNLTAAQKAQLEPIITAEAAELKPIFEDQSLDKKERREKMRAVHEKYRPQIHAVLTPEQQQKLKELRKDFRGPGKGHGKGHGKDNDKD